MSYETLDKIADSYNPILLILSIATVFWKAQCSKRSMKLVIAKLAFLLVLILNVYILMFIDNHFVIWRRLGGLDYSTHTALSLVFVLFIGYFQASYRVVLGFSYIGYIILMLYQQYHTIMDIVSTIAILGPLSYFVLKKVPELFRIKEVCT